MVMLASGFGSRSSAQDANVSSAVQQIELYKMNGADRVVISCDGPVVSTSRFDTTTNRLSLFLRHARFALPRPEYRFTALSVRRVRASQWHKSPAIVRIDIFLTHAATYTIKRVLDGLLFVDILPDEPQPPPRLEKAAVPGPGEPSNNRETNRRRSSLTVAGRDDMTAALASKESVSLDVKDAEISDVLRLLARQSRLNIVTSGDVRGKVTLSLTRVTVKEALDMVVKVNGFAYMVQNDIILVKPRDKFDSRELETKVYRLRYLDANNVKITAGQILSPSAKVQVFYPSFRQVDQQEGEGKKVDHSQRSSTLIVTDSPANLRQLEAMLEALDVPVPQIMIEAKLIEVAPGSEQKLGINWDKMISGQIFREVILPSGKPVERAVDVPLAGGAIQYGTLSINRYKAVLDFLSSKTHSKLVSNPRILAMDNQEAVISVGTTFPIPQINRGVGGQGDQVTFEYREFNIALRVTPHLAEDETITLFVKPDVEEIIGEVLSGGNSAPITSRRSVETVVNLKNNETVVIGGLIRENLEETIRKVWLLGDIPIIGALFRHRETRKRQTDLLIFITPRIVSP